MDPDPAWDEILDPDLVQNNGISYDMHKAFVHDSVELFFTKSRSDITNIVNWSLNDDFSTAYQNISKLKIFKGLALQVFERLLYSLPLVPNKYVTVRISSGIFTNCL